MSNVSNNAKLNLILIGVLNLQMEYVSGDVELRGWLLV